MLNLLLISNSPKAQFLKRVLQPVLRVIIDVVPDFDRGLKDVFEKRPATVCIQDQIAGVTGESVARHIQMLLGDGAPNFILMHDGNSKVKPVTGLFDHVIDLSRTDADLAIVFQNTLKTILGEQWPKIHIKPVQEAEPVALPVSELPQGDEKPDDSLQDFDTKVFIPAVSKDSVDAVPDVPPQNTMVHNSVDEMLDLLLAQASQEANAAPAPTNIATVLENQSNSPLKAVENDMENSAIEESVVDNHKYQVTPIQNIPLGTSKLNSMLTTADQVAESVSKSPPLTPASESAVPKAKSTYENSRTMTKPGVTVAPTTPAKFKIYRDGDSAEEPIPEDLLLAFEKNYRSRTTYMKFGLLTLSVLVVVSGAGWYFLKQNNQFWGPSKQQVQLPTQPKASPLPAEVQPHKTEQKLPQVQAPAPIVAPVLPTFIPQDGYDSSYAAKNAGWERYVGNKYEARVFKTGVTIKAVQIVSVKGNPLSEVFLKSVLMDLTGSSDYQVNFRETKSGVLVMRGKVAQKADIITYHKKTLLKAFVVSLN